MRNGYAKRFWCGILAFFLCLTAAGGSAPAFAGNKEKGKGKKELSRYTNEIEGWAKGPEINGDSAVVIEAGSGAVLYAKNMDKREFPASITKLLTALLVFESGSLDATVKITKESLACLASGGYASIGVEENNVLTMKQALYAMLLASSNEVAYAIGETVAERKGKDYEWFIKQMNERCRKLGGENSHFTNANGVHDKEHYSCARDMALIARELFKYPEFFSICQTGEYKIPASQTTEEHIFTQHHQMLQKDNENYCEDVLGGKTGYTPEADNTLVTMAERGGTQLVCVVMKTQQGYVYSDTKALLEYGFQNFKKIPVKDVEQAADKGGIPKDAYVVLPKGARARSLKREEEPSGEITYFYKNVPVGSFSKGEIKLGKEEKPVFAEADGGEKKEEKKTSKLLKAFLGILFFGAGTAAAVFLYGKYVKSRTVVRRIRERRGYKKKKKRES